MAKRIPQHKVDEIYAAADIVEIVGDFVELKKRGSNYFGLSPFSNEKTPSFAVSPSKNIFKDFSSGKGGSAVTFLMEAEGMTYVEALKYVAEKYGIALELEETPEDHILEDKRDSLYILNEFAAKFFHEQIMEDDKGRKIALSYLKERGILESTAKEFAIGYSPEGWDSLSSLALKKQFKEEYLVETGLCFKSDKDGKLLDRFRGRLMFPIHNHLGKVVGFGGRVLGNKDKMAKYINSPESEIYHKSRVLYGLYQARQAIRDTDQCILTEGYMDTVALAQAGIRNVVASSGTALTEEQIKLIGRFTKNVLMIYDADRAGIAAALRGADLILEKDMAVRALLLPEGEDPDSFVKAKGKSGFEEYLREHSRDILDFKIDHLLEGLDPSDPQQKAQLIHEAAATVARIPDPVKQSVYVSTAAQRLKISPEVMEQALSKAVTEKLKQERRSKQFEQRRQGYREGQRQLQNQNEFGFVETRPDTGEVVQEAPQVKEIAQEKEILRLLINYPEAELQVAEDETLHIADFVREELEGLDFTTPQLERLKNELLRYFAEKGKLDVPHFLHHSDPELSAATAALITIPFEVSGNWEKFDIRAPKIDEDLDEAITDAVLHYKRYKLAILLKETRQLLRKAEAGSEQDELIKKYNVLLRMNKELMREIGAEGGLDPNISALD